MEQDNNKAAPAPELEALKNGAAGGPAMPQAQQEPMIQLIQGTYQILILPLLKEGKVRAMSAPTGFRLHSVTPIIQSGIIGVATQAIFTFECIEQVVLPQSAAHVVLAQSKRSTEATKT
jgi:hypothetical protein